MNNFSPSILQGWKVVIVEDEVDSQEVARYILDFYGATVETADDGKEGIEVIKRVRPDFVISDLSMPVMDGWELIHQLKSNLATRDIPVIALTAHAMLGDRERALAVGFHNYLTKPLTADTFMQQLVQLLLNIPSLNDRLNL